MVTPPSEDTDTKSAFLMSKKSREITANFFGNISLNGLHIRQACTTCTVEELIWDIFSTPVGVEKFSVDSETEIEKHALVQWSPNCTTLLAFIYPLGQYVQYVSH